MNLGSFALNDTIDLMFTTRDATGAPATLTSGALAAYVDNSVTQVTAGITLTADFDSVTGLNHVRIVASAANGYDAGNTWNLVLTGGTVDSVSVVGEVVARFLVGLYAPVNVLAINGNTSAAATARDFFTSGANLPGSTVSVGAVSQAAIVDAVLDEALSGHTTAGTLGKAVADIETTASAILDDTGSSGVAIAAGQSVASVTGAVASVTGNVGGNVNGSVGSLATQAKADVNAEMVDCLTVDTYAEPASVPAATASFKDKLGWVCALFRNKTTQTADTTTLRNDADSGSIATSTRADDGTTATKGEWT